MAIKRFYRLEILNTGSLTQNLGREQNHLNDDDRKSRNLK